MPSVIANAVWFLVAEVGIPYAVVAFVGTLTVTTLLSSLSSKLFGPKVESVGLSPMDVMVRSGLEHRKIIYGQAIVSGPIYWNNLSGTNNEYLWYCVALCDGLSEDLVEVQFDGDVIPKADISWTAGTGASDGTGTGDVSTSAFVGANSTKAVQIFYYLGDDAQPVSGDLDTAFSEITTNHRLRGVTHVIAKLLYDEDTAKVWEGGPPNNIKAVIKGRLIYDPRLDSTQIINATTSPVTYGSGAHRTTDATTWAWSENPSLCIADYLTQIMGVATTAIDWPSVADSADDCEVLVVIPPAASPENQEARFTCNGVLSLGSTHKDNLDSILSSMAGKLSYTGGVWKVRASVWESSSVTITEDDLAGDVDVRGSAPRSERFNGVRGFFIDPARNYEAAEFPHVSEATYVTRDNGKSLLYDLQLPMTNSATEAQRIAYRNLGQGNNQIIAKLKLNAKGSKIAIGDVVTHTLSALWSTKTFRCIEWARNSDGTFAITLKEDDSTDYTDPLVTAYGTAGTGGVTIPADIVKPPTSLAAAAVGAGIELTWTNPPALNYDFIDIYQSSSSAWGGASKIARVRADTYVVPLFAGEVRYFWVRAVKLPDLESLRSPDSDTSSVSATAPTGAGGAAGSATTFVNQYIRQAGAPSTPGTTSASYNFDTTTFTPTSSWSIGVPAVGSPTLPVWVSTAQFYSADSTGTDSNTTWTTPQKLAEDGIDGSDGATGSTGTDGLNSATVNLYHKNTSSSTPPTAFSGTFTYTFSTAALSGGTLNGWSQDAPDIVAGEYLWIRQAAAVSNTSTDSVPAAEFAAAVVVGIGGSDGATGSTGSAGTDGLNNAIVFLYNSNTSDVTPPSAFSGTFTYTFATGVLSGGTLNGWAQSAPDIAAGEYLWLRQATASSNTSTDSVPAAEFSAAAVIAIGGSDGATGSTGAAGSDGATAVFVNQFIRNASAPSTPGTTSASYNFDTTTFTPTSSWAAGVPAAGSPTLAIWVSTAQFYSADGTGTDSNTTWTAPQKLAEDGVAGTDGTPGTDGTDPIVSSLTNSAHVVATASDGTGYSLTGSGGTHEVLEGVTDRTVAATHSVSGTATKNGLTMSVTSSGVYSLADGSTDSPQVFWTSDSESFTLRSVYGGVTNDKIYTIAKAKAGTGSPVITAVGGYLTDAAIDPANATVTYRVNSTGVVQKEEGTGAGMQTLGTWLNSGTNSDYQIKAVKDSGTTPTGDSLDTWHGMGSSFKDFILTETVEAGAALNCMLTITWRHATTFEVLGSAQVSLNADVISGA